MVGHAGGQVEHVAGGGDELFAHGHVGQKFQLIGGLAGRALVAHVANLPAAVAGGLNQKDVIPIEVWADTATFGGIADHDVFHPPVGQEGEIVQQQRGFSEEVIHGLDQ